MQHYVSKEVACPFYSQEDSIRIYHIEGISKGNRVHISFGARDRLKLHKKLYCNSVTDHQRCPIYKLLAEKYGGDENG